MPGTSSAQWRWLIRQFWAQSGAGSEPEANSLHGPVMNLLRQGQGQGQGPPQSRASTDWQGHAFSLGWHLLSQNIPHCTCPMSTESSPWPRRSAGVRWHWHPLMSHSNTHTHTHTTYIVFGRHFFSLLPGDFPQMHQIDLVGHEDHGEWLPGEKRNSSSAFPGEGAPGEGGVPSHQAWRSTQHLPMAWGWLQSLSFHISRGGRGACGLLAALVWSLIPVARWVGTLLGTLWLYTVWASGWVPGPTSSHLPVTVTHAQAGHHAEAISSDSWRAPGPGVGTRLPLNNGSYYIRMAPRRVREGSGGVSAWKFLKDTCGHAPVPKSMKCPSQSIFVSSEYFP